MVALTVNPARCVMERKMGECMKVKTVGRYDRNKVNHR